MFGALYEVAVDDPAIGHVVADVLVSIAKTLGNVFVDVRRVADRDGAHQPGIGERDGRRAHGRRR